jgi:hypothetical protein
MEVILETTEWDTPNHTYVLNKAGKLVGYRKATTGEICVSKRPLMFDKKRRKFKKVVDKELLDAILVK